MKIRTSFVSNSSSASFVVDKVYLTPLQIAQIKDHINVAKQLMSVGVDNPGCWRDYDFSPGDAWIIKETKTQIKGETSMANFPMRWFFKQIGVIRDPVSWDGDELPG
jgi:hypothetical protein